MSTDEVLAQLDAAVNDWEVSSDAMRCNKADDTIERTWQPAHVSPPPVLRPPAPPQPRCGLRERISRFMDRLPELLYRESL